MYGIKWIMNDGKVEIDDNTFDIKGEAETYAGIEMMQMEHSEEATKYEVISLKS